MPCVINIWYKTPARLSNRVKEGVENKCFLRKKCLFFMHKLKISVSFVAVVF